MKHRKNRQLERISFQSSTVVHTSFWVRTNFRGRLSFSAQFAGSRSRKTPMHNALMLLPAVGCMYIWRLFGNRRELKL